MGGSMVAQMAGSVALPASATHHQPLHLLLHIGVR